MIWVETIINGIFLGGLYGLIGLGLGFTFGVMKVVNVAQGDFIVAAAFIGLFLAPWTPENALLVIIPVALIAFAIGVLLQFAIINRVLGTDQIPQILVTFGLAIILRNGMVQFFGANNRSIQVGEIRYASFNVFGLHLGLLPAIIVLISLALFAALQLWLRYSNFGRKIRATADDFEIVQLLGVNYRLVYGVAMGIALALSSVAGVLLAVRGSFTPYSGVDRLLIAFETVIIGGLGSFWGMFAGGIVLGVAQLVGLKFDSNSGLMYGHLVFFIMLILMPTGIAGRFRK
jgi:branched-chain amino acid transport system permease protein